MWTYSVVTCVLCKGFPEEAYQLLKEMERNGCFSDGVTHSTIIHGLLRNKENTKAAQVVGEMVKSGFSASVATMELWINIITNGTSSCFS